MFQHLGRRCRDLDFRRISPLLYPLYPKNLDCRSFSDIFDNLARWLAFDRALCRLRCAFYKQIEVANTQPGVGHGHLALLATALLGRLYLSRNNSKKMFQCNPLLLVHCNSDPSFWMSCLSAYW